MVPLVALVAALEVAAGAADTAAGAAPEVPEPAPAIWIATTPPKGPAPDGLTILTRQTLDWPPTVPVQVVPAGMVAAKG